MPQKIDQQRLEWFKAQIERLGIRFPVAEIAEKTGSDQGNVSSYLKGKKPLSDNFLTKFREAYEIESDGFEEDDTTKQILLTLAEAFKAQTEILRDMRKEMARADIQNKMEANLKRTLAAALTVSKGQVDGMKEIRDLFLQIQAHQKPLSVDDGKGRGQIDEVSEKKGKTPA